MGQGNGSAIEAERVEGGAGHAAAVPAAGEHSGGDRDRSGRSGADHRAGAVTPIPASIVKAICAIQVTVEAVKKSQRNAHGGYNYASTDDIYAAITRKMGEVGLVMLALEDRCEIKRLEGKDGKTVQWAHMEFSFVLATASDTWTDPRARRTLYIQVTGPQTFQAAQSYCEKAYLRGVFKLPTGDMDLDSMPQAESEEDQNNLLAPRKPKSSSKAKKDGDDAVFNDLRGAIYGADGPADLAAIKQQSFSVWNAMPARWREILDAEFDDAMAAFMADEQST